MPKRYTSKSLITMAYEYGWELVSIKGSHHNFKHKESRFILTIKHPSERHTCRQSCGYSQKNQIGGKMMRFFITLEKTDTGYSVQVPDLAIITYGKTIDDAKNEAADAIRINLESYYDAAIDVPFPLSPLKHIENPDFTDLLFAFVNVSEPEKNAA